MLKHTHIGQARTLAKAALKHEWRTASARLGGKRRKINRWWAVWSLFSYLLVGAMLIRLFVGNEFGGAFTTAASIVILYASTITASNIFMSFGSGFLSPDEALIIEPLPVTSETFFFSRLIVLLVYSSIVSFSIVLCPAVALCFFKQLGAGLAVALLLSGILASITSAFAVITIYGLVFRNLAADARTKILSYVQMVGSLVVALSFVILPQIERHLNLSDYTIQNHPWFIALPPFWFASWTAVVRGDYSSIPLILSCVALGSLIILSAASLLLLAKNYQSDVGGLNLVARPKSRIKSTGKPLIALKSLARSPEGRAVLTLFRSQMRYDAKFRMSLVASLPITLVYLIMALFQGGIKDPFVAGLRATGNAPMLYIIAMLMPLLQMQAFSQSDNFKASWIFYAAPLDRSLLLLSVRNMVVAYIMVPYMIILAIIFSFSIPPAHAFEHVMVMAAMAGFIFQVFLMITPKMPFSERRKPNKNNYSYVLGVGFFALLAFGLLVVEIHFAYKTPLRFWVSVVILLALSVLMERAARIRISRKLAQQEFEG